jgi:hypothetical protein
MNTLSRNTALSILAGLALVTVSASPASADSNRNRLLLSPGADTHLVPHPNLPRFGFASFNIRGVGERVTTVRFGGLASRFGLEPGDIILSMNGHRLSYHGSWNDALFDAMVNHGGLVRLKIRDVRTGFVAQRQLFIGGGVGPVTPHFHDGDHVHFHSAPTTKKLIIGSPNGGPTLNKKIVKLQD